MVSAGQKVGLMRLCLATPPRDTYHIDRAMVSFVANGQACLGNPPDFDSTTEYFSKKWIRSKLGRSAMRSLYAGGDSLAYSKLAQG